VLQPLRHNFQSSDFPNLLVGLEAADDAAVYRISESQAIVTTVDFFPPVVDDPYDFGAIAASNSLSDIYAMGAQPLFAMNLVAYPDGFALDYLQEILRGGAEKIAEAGAVIAGGHSITDKEPKYGLSVTGLVDPREIRTKGGSEPGDLLVLTKPLGTGVITTALKRESSLDEHVKEAVQHMVRLNKQAAEAAGIAGVRSMTDVTGFGLLGHAHEMAHLGKRDFRIFVDNLPWLPGALDYGKAEMFPGGTWNNEGYFSQWVDFTYGIDPTLRNLLWTPETSGGLLAAIAPSRLSEFTDNTGFAFVIGEVKSGNGRIEVI